MTTTDDFTDRVQLRAEKLAALEEAAAAVTAHDTIITAWEEKHVPIFDEHSDLIAHRHELIKKLGVAQREFFNAMAELERSM